MVLIKMIKELVTKILPKKTNRRLFVSWILRSHLHGFRAVARSIYCTKKLTGNYFPIQCLVYPKMELHLKVHKTSDVQLQGQLRVKPCLASSGSVYLDISKNAKLLIKNDFEVGQNIQIIISANGSLIFGGKDKSSGSGITSDTKIFVAEYVEIGEDSIIAWDCFITDSNWHGIKGVEKTRPVYIGKHVWLSHGVSVLKGAKIADNTIVGAKSLVSHAHTQSAVLLAGSPAIIIKKNVSWSR
jgi:acetyltransferase-like isoleucine patch superfamily enzyme